MSDLRFDIGSLHAAYAAGVSPLEMIDTVLKRIGDAGDPGIFLHLAEKAVLVAEVKALGTFDPVSRPLWGIPFAVKDNIDVAATGHQSGSMRAGETSAAVAVCGSCAP